MLTAALTVFVLVGQPREGHYRPPIPAWTLALTVAVPLVAVCVIASRRAIGRTRAMLLAVAVAVLLGMIAVLTKVCTHRFASGGWHALMTVPAPYVLVALAVALTVLQQSAFHAGAQQASVPIMLVGLGHVGGHEMLFQANRSHAYAPPLCLQPDALGPLMRRPDGGRRRHVGARKTLSRRRGAALRRLVAA